MGPGQFLNVLIYENVSRHAHAFSGHAIHFKYMVANISWIMSWTTWKKSDIFNQNRRMSTKVEHWQYGKFGCLYRKPWYREKTASYCLFFIAELIVNLWEHQGVKSEKSSQLCYPLLLFGTHYALNSHSSHVNIWPFARACADPCVHHCMRKCSQKKGHVTGMGIQWIGLNLTHFKTCEKLWKDVSNWCYN